MNADTITIGLSKVIVDDFQVYTETTVYDATMGRREWAYYRPASYVNRLDLDTLRACGVKIEDNRTPIPQTQDEANDLIAAEVWHHHIDGHEISAADAVAWFDRAI